jgi:hypothetical protein
MSPAAFAANLTLLPAAQGCDQSLIFRLSTNCYTDIAPVKSLVVTTVTDQNFLFEQFCLQLN